MHICASYLLALLPDENHRRGAHQQLLWSNFGPLSASSTRNKFHLNAAYKVLGFGLLSEGKATLSFLDSLSLYQFPHIDGSYRWKLRISVWVLRTFIDTVIFTISQIIYQRNVLKMCASFFSVGKISCKKFSNHKVGLSFLKNKKFRSRHF